MDTTTRPTAERIEALKAAPVLSIAQCVELGDGVISKSTVRRAIDAGDLPAHKIGRRVAIPTPAFLAFIGAA